MKLNAGKTQGRLPEALRQCGPVGRLLFDPHGALAERLLDAVSGAWREDGAGTPDQLIYVTLRLDDEELA